MPSCRLTIVIAAAIAMSTQLTAVSAHCASQSIILDSDGYACMGEDKSRKQTETAAFNDAKRKAAESATTYIQTETQVKDALLEKDLLSAYSNAQIKVVTEFFKEWYQEKGLGDCYRVKLKVEVIPDEQSMKKVAQRQSSELLDDPTAPLTVKVWSDKPRYAQGEKMHVFVKGNRPFYGRVVYQDAAGNLVQLLPNPYRQNSYFNGGVVYEIPAAEDRFDLEVAPPFGAERITLYASSAPLGEVGLTASGGVYSVSGKREELAVTTRGISFVAKQSGATATAAEFSEANHETSTAAK